MFLLFVGHLTISEQLHWVIYNYTGSFTITLGRLQLHWVVYNYTGSFTITLGRLQLSRGFAVFADAWLSGWLAEISADLRETVAH